MCPHPRLRAARLLARAAARSGLALAYLALLVAALAAGGARAQVPAPLAPAEAEPAGEAVTVAEALRLLAVVLEDPEARATLVEQLRAVAPAPAPEAPPAVTVPEIIADQTLTLAESATRQIQAVLEDVLALGQIVVLARDFDFATAFANVLPVLFVIVLVVAVLWLVRVATRPLLRRLEARAATDRLLARWSWQSLGLLLEVGRVALAWAIGYAAALLIGDGRMHLEQSLFLNAFLAVEMARILPRVVLRPRAGGLRALRLKDATARRWHFWIARIIGLVGYAALFIAPLLRAQGAPRFAEWLLLAAVLLAVLMAVIFILRNRTEVRRGIKARIAHLPPGLLSAALYQLALFWHVIAIAYVLALFVVWRVYPGEALAFMARATLASAAAILLGAILIALITRRIVGGVALSERTNREMPTLEARLNRFVPAVLQVLRLVVAVVVAAAILTFWGVVDFPGWIGSPAGAQVIWSFLWIGGILVFASSVYILISSWIEYRLNPDVGALPTPRERTLLALFSNAVVIALGIMTVMFVLTEFGINIAPLLAGAGIAGLAIGFGAQKLVQDIINGAFIQFENTMNEGDVVTAGGITGVVEKLTVRSVSLRDLEGRYHMIPFSGVDTVTNFMKGFSFHVAEIGVAYRERIPEVKTALFEAFDRLMETDHRANILPPLEMQGVTAFADSAIMVRARIKTLPGQQWATGRAYSELIKEVFDERGIEIPFPHRTIYIGQDKQGDSPPLNLRTLPRRKRAGSQAPGLSGDAREHVEPVPPDPELTPPATEED